MASGYEYDIAIIGAGPGGYVAALRAVQLGARGALVEKDAVGAASPPKPCWQAAAPWRRCGERRRMACRWPRRQWILPPYSGGKIKW